MTDDEIIAVVQAHKEGKQIQWSHRSKNQWYDFVNQPEWNFTEYLFRVKPEPRKPREWWVEVPTDGSIGRLFQFTTQLTQGGSELVRVREVIEE